MAILRKTMNFIFGSLAPVLGLIPTILEVDEIAVDVVRTIQSDPIDIPKIPYHRS
jgi:hypothetical protein